MKELPASYSNRHRES